MRAVTSVKHTDEISPCKRLKGTAAPWAAATHSSRCTYTGGGGGRGGRRWDTYLLTYLLACLLAHTNRRGRAAGRSATPIWVPDVCMARKAWMSEVTAK